MVDRVAMDVSDVVASASPGAGTVHGMVVGQVSQVKRSSKRNDVQYFDGQFSDGVNTIRLVSFEPNLRSKIEQAQKAQSSIALQNCTFKRSREKCEIHVNKHTSVMPSPKN